MHSGLGVVGKRRKQVRATRIIPAYLPTGVQTPPCSPHGGYTRRSPHHLYGLPPLPPASAFVGAGDLSDVNHRRMCAADRGRKLCTHKLRLSQINVIDLVRALLSSFKAQTAGNPLFPCPTLGAPIEAVAHLVRSCMDMKSVPILKGSRRCMCARFKAERQFTISMTTVWLYSVYNSRHFGLLTLYIYINVTLVL